MTTSTGRPSRRPRVAAIIVAAGMGRRMAPAGNGRHQSSPEQSPAKQFLTLSGRPILAHTIDRFESTPGVGEIIVVVPAGDEERCEETVVRPFGFRKVTRIIPGGEARQASVACGLASLADGVELVAVHDGVRPCVTTEQIAAVIAAAVEHDGAILAVPLRDTPKEVGDNRLICRTLDRRALWLAQTPQIFRRAVLDHAYATASRDGYLGTDDAALVERLGYHVAVVEGSPQNLKITTVDDLPVAERWLAAVHG